MYINILIGLGSALRHYMRRADKVHFRVYSARGHTDTTVAC